jgi:hypothetical protein
MKAAKSNLRIPISIIARGVRQGRKDLAGRLNYQPFHAILKEAEIKYFSEVNR